MSHSYTSPDGRKSAYVYQTGIVNRLPSIGDLSGFTSGNRGKRVEKIFSNKVHVPWYRRYYSYVPEYDRAEIQPFVEVIPEGFTDQKRKEDLKKMTTQPKKRNSIDESESEFEKKRQMVLQTRERSVIQPIANYLSWVRRKRMRRRKDFSELRGRWLRFFTPDMKRKIKDMAENMRRARARHRFRKIIMVVYCYKAFISTLKELHPSSDLMLNEISNQAESQEAAINRKGTFDPYKYKVNNKMDESATVPFSIKLILSKPWYTRTEAEVNEVVQCLYGLFIFVRYPVNVSKQLARVAWYSKLNKGRPIIRQSDPVHGFCFLLSGLAKVCSTQTDMFGRPYEVLHRKISRGELFGEDEVVKIHPIRRASVTTMAASELMTINFSDYQQSLLHPYGHGRIPIHLKIVKRHACLKTISLLDIVSHALDCFPCMYFPPNTVIVDSLKQSDYVFLVLQGECFAADLLNPPNPDHEDFIRRVSEGEDIVDQMRLASNFFNPSFTSGNGLKVAKSKGELREEKIRKELLKSKEEFAEDIQRLCENSLATSKEELIREIKPKRVLGHLVGSEGAAQERAVSEDIVKKMRAYEEGNEEYKALIQRTSTKTENLKRVLARLDLAKSKKAHRKRLFFDIARKSTDSSFSGSFDANASPSKKSLETTEGLRDPDTGNISSIEIDIRDLYISKTGIRRSLEEDKRFIEAERVLFPNISKPQIEDDQTKKESGDQTDTENIERQTVKSDTGVPSVSSTLVFTLPSNHGISQPEDAPKTGADGETKETKKSKNRVTMKLDYESEEENKKSTVGKESTSSGGSRGGSQRLSYFQKHSTGHGFRLEMGDAKASVRGHSYAGALTKHSVSDRKGTLNLNRIDSDSEFITTRKSTATELDPTLVYKKTSIFRKNTLVGNDYLDYNDGKFREQSKDLALISGGTELVMIAKWYLLKHLYHHW